MVSKISVYNLVAGMLGESPVIVMPTSQDGTLIARAIDRYWESARGAALRANTWRFARARVSLPPLSAPPAFGFAYAFNLPPDFVRLVDVGTFGGGCDSYEREGKTILANYAPLNLVYIRDMPEPESWDGDFELGFAMLFAGLAAYDVTGDQSLGDTLLQRFKAQFADADVADGNDGPPLTFVEDSWLRARWGDPYGGGGYGEYAPLASGYSTPFAPPLNAVPPNAPVLGADGSGLAIGTEGGASIGI